MSYHQQLKHEVSHFFVIGLLATSVDFALYFWWHYYVTFSIAKTCSFTCGSLIVYFLNKFFTFKQPHRSHAEMIRFMILYASTMLANVWSNSLCLWLTKLWLPLIWHTWSTEVIIIAFICATGVSTVINFLGQKFWVFRHKRKI